MVKRKAKAATPAPEAPAELEQREESAAELEPPHRTPDEHGVTPRTCNTCGADATNYAICPVCRSTDLTYPA